MKRGQNRKRDWLDVTLKALTPIVAGLLIAWAGFVTQMALSRVASDEESARLVTELQVKREQTESEIRKDVFDRALTALLDQDSGDGSVRSLSKRLLRLELLALNFGDSLSLSPLFTDFNRDLDEATPVDVEDSIDHPERIAVLRRRLQGLARRVASAQLSSVAQHGVSVEVRVPLSGLDMNTCNAGPYEQGEYKWPHDEVKQQLKGLEATPDYEKHLRAGIRELGTVQLGDVTRHVTLTFSKVDHCSKSTLVNMSMERMARWPGATDSGITPPPALRNKEITREFRLNLFNFPKVDNTRLSDNQRFAIVMEEFNTKDDPHIAIAAVVFPAEYASFKDRPGMREALQLLRSALDSKSSDTAAR